eukprot:14365161-Alexandrium_andersonii.AAC.1
MRRKGVWPGMWRAVLPALHEMRPPPPGQVVVEDEAEGDDDEADEEDSPAPRVPGQLAIEDGEEEEQGPEPVRAAHAPAPTRGLPRRRP